MLFELVGVGATDVNRNLTLFDTLSWEIVGIYYDFSLEISMGISIHMGFRNTGGSINDATPIAGDLVIPACTLSGRGEN